MRRLRHNWGTRGSARPSFRALACVALMVLSWLALSTAPAAAQPDPGACIDDPAACLPEVPDAPNPDPCLENPQSCLPDLPDPDPCLENPQSCLPEVPDPGDVVDDVTRCANDPIGCVEETTETVERCASDLTGCLEEAAAPVGDVATCAKDPERCLSDATDPLYPGLDEVLGANGVAPPGLGSGPGRDRDTGGDNNGAGDDASGSSEDAATGDAGFNDPLTSLVETRQVDDGARGPFGDIGRIFGDIIRRFGFPLALLAAVALYLGIQNRLDRKDPKLALAPLDSQRDFLTFE